MRDEPASGAIPLEPEGVAIADLHLDPASAEDCAPLVDWLDGLQVPRLLILGDLFDAWVGPAHQRLEGSQAVIAGLNRLAGRGGRIDLLHGNRDFLLDERFAEACGASLWPEGVVGALPSGERVAFVHGDTLCTRDHAYQRYRRLSHSSLVRRLALSLPLFISSRIVRRLRRVSVQAVAAKLPEEKALQMEAATRLARETGAGTVVCGHAHEARDEPLPSGPRWIVLDAFGGARDVLRVGEGGELALTGSGTVGFATMIIAIDGPAGAGKSTIARRLADELGLFFLDTGAMYRSVSLEALRRGIDPADGAAVARLAGDLDLRFDPEGRIEIDGRSGEPDIRGAEVDAVVSLVAADPGVRAAVVPKQKLIAERRGGVVAEGRDTTTVVFPEADHRFFLDASADERARRRAAQVGSPEREDEIRRGILERDRIDSTRENSPLTHAEGVERVVTDGLTVDEVVALLLERVQSAEGAG